MNGNTLAYLQLCQRLSLTPILLKSSSNRPQTTLILSQVVNTGKLEASTDLHVRLVPDISAAAFRCKKTKELALWYILRALNLSGSGVIDKSLVIDQLQKTFNYSQRTAYEHLALGKGLFWQTIKVKGRSRIEICGLLRVAERLCITRILNAHFRELPSSEFATPAKRKAQMYTSIHCPASIKSNPISRDSIAEYTGISKSRQRRLERIARVHRVPNYAMQFQRQRIKVNDKGELVVLPNDSTEFDIERVKVTPVKVEVQGKNRVYRVNKRLPNSYRTKQEPGSHGMLRRISKQLRSFRVDEAQGLVRRYFSGYKRLAKALIARGDGSEGYAKIKPYYRLEAGRQEWALCSI